MIVVLTCVRQAMSCQLCDLDRQGAVRQKAAEALPVVSAHDVVSSSVEGVRGSAISAAGDIALTTPTVVLVGLMDSTSIQRLERLTRLNTTLCLLAKL